MRSNTLFKKHRIKPDKKYNSLVVSKLINVIMIHGKKTICENKIVYPALKKLIKYYLENFKDIDKDDPNLVDKIIVKCLNNVVYKDIIKVYKFGGAIIRAPLKKYTIIGDPLSFGYMKSIRILGKILRNRHKKFRTINKNSFKGMTASEKLFLELKNTIKKKSEIYKLWELHKALSDKYRMYSHLVKSRKRIKKK